MRRCRQQQWFVRADMAVGEPVSQGRAALWRGESEEEDSNKKKHLAIVVPPNKPNICCLN